MGEHVFNPWYTVPRKGIQDIPDWMIPVFIRYDRYGMFKCLAAVDPVILLDIQGDIGHIGISQDGSVPFPVHVLNNIDPFRKLVHAYGSG